MNSALVHYSQLTCQQLRAKHTKIKKEKKRERKRVKRETRNAAMDVESKHILNHSLTHKIIMIKNLIIYAAIKLLLFVT